MNVRAEVRQAEHEIKTAIIVALAKLKESTGLHAHKLTVDFMDATTYSSVDERPTVIGQVKLHIGL